MIDIVRVYINGERVEVPKIATLLGALEIADPELAHSVQRGSHMLADSRGLTTSPDTAVYDGAIVRVVHAR